MQDLKARIIKIRKGDMVKVLSGKDNGKEGKVLKISSKDGKALVEGLNLVKRHIKGREGVEGGILDLPKPMDLSNLMLICPKCKKPTRIGYKFEADSKLRICKKCKEVI